MIRMLLGPVLAVLASVALGRVALRAARAPLAREEENVLGFAFGAACLGALVTVLAAAHLARKGAMVALAASALALALAAARKRSPKRLAPLEPAWRVFFAAAVAAFGFVYVVNAAAPEIIAGDTLGLVLREWDARRLLAFPDGMRMLLLFAFTFGMHSSAALLHCAFLFALPLLMVSWVRRHELPGGAGVLAALLVFASPLVARNGTAALEETALACVLFAAFYLFDMGAPLPALLLAAFGLTFRGGGAAVPVTIFGGEGKAAAGPLFLLAPLALLALREPRGRRLLAAAPAAFLVGGIIGAMPFVALAMGLALARSRGMAPLVAGAQVLFCWPGALSVWSNPETWRLAEVPVLEVVRRDLREDYPLWRLPGYGLARMVEQYVPPGGKVFAFARVPSAYTLREVTGDPLLRDALLTAFTPALQPAERFRYGFPARRVSSLRITGGGAVTEFRVLSGGREVPRRAEWRLTAAPDVFTAALAFDNSAVTRWSGTSLEVRFPEPLLVDGVELDCPPGQSAFALEGAEPPSRIALPPAPHLREAAMEELRARGIRYLVVRNNDPGAADFRENEIIWGIAPLVEYYDARVYRLD